MVPSPDPASALIEDPILVFMVLASIVTGSLWLSSRSALKKVSEIVPPPIWALLIPMTLTTIGVLPNENPAYIGMATILVPTSLFLLTVTSDFRSTLKIGHLALIMLAAGTSGILIGGFFSFLSVRSFLPEEAWKGFAVMSGAWIGGSANGLAVQQGLDADPAIITPLIMVDSLLGFVWVTLLLFLGSRQRFLAKLFRNDPSLTLDMSGVKVEKIERGPLTAAGLSSILFVALVASAIAAGLGSVLPEYGDPVIVSQTTWTIMLIVGLGVVASFTPLRKLEKDGASDVGFLLIMLLLSALGARGNFEAFLEGPIYFIAGLVWLGGHLIVLAFFAWLFRAPPSLFALGSVANIGGFVTAPIVATAYNRSLVPTALLLAAIAQIAGIYLPFAFASVLSSMSQ